MARKQKAPAKIHMKNQDKASLKQTSCGKLFQYFDNIKTTEEWKIVTCMSCLKRQFYEVD